jgi:hypothetical protein
MAACVESVKLHAKGYGATRRDHIQCSISACEKDSQWQLALNLLSLRQGAKVLPEGIKHSAAISAREKGGQ